jgi:hypothetical protein
MILVNAIEESGTNCEESPEHDIHHYSCGYAGSSLVQWRHPPWIAQGIACINATVVLMAIR